jgi:predicted DNA repair protein MutK
MFLVGGGILTHGVPFLHRLSEGLARQAGTFSSHLALILPTAFDAAVGIVLGGLLVLVVSVGSRLIARPLQNAL